MSTKEQLGLGERKLARPLDKMSLQNDEAVLRQLVGFINNPNITGAEAPKESKQPLPEGRKGETLVIDAMPADATNDLPMAPLPPRPAIPLLEPTEAPIPAPPVSSEVGARLFFTGRESSKLVQAIGAVEFSIAADVVRLANFFFGTAVFPDKDATVNSNPGAQNFLDTIKAWGSGEVSATYPVTPARATFVIMIRSMSEVLPKIADWTQFGKNEGFWIDTAVNAARKHTGGRVVITGLSSMTEFKYFQALGFQHWHCMGAAIPGAVENKLLTGLNNSVTQQISEVRSGNKLHCVWIGPAMPATGRIWTLQSFIAASAAKLKGQTIVE